MEYRTISGRIVTFFAELLARPRAQPTPTISGRTVTFVAELARATAHAPAPTYATYETKKHGFSMGAGQIATLSGRIARFSRNRGALVAPPGPALPKSSPRQFRDEINRFAQPSRELGNRSSLAIRRARPIQGAPKVPSWSRRASVPPPMSLPRSGTLPDARTSPATAPRNDGRPRHW